MLIEACEDSYPLIEARSKTMMALALMQMFATLSFAILYSTIILYSTQKLKISALEATSIMGTFGAFNYGLHLLGGFFGGRFLSWRSLFAIGMLLQVIGCLILAITTVNCMFIGLAIFLTGSGLNVTCVNMLVTQFFEPNDKKRENAFLWNYACMNIGFFIGFSAAGYFQLHQNFHSLFIFASLGNLLTLLLLIPSWKKIKDRTTILGITGKNEYLQRMILGLGLIALTIPILFLLLKHSAFSNELVLVVGLIMFCLLLGVAIRDPNNTSKNKIFAYLIFAVASLIFWTLYQLAPMALTLFAEYNVNRHVLGFLIAPQWIQNINTFIIAIGGPLLGIILLRLEKKGIKITLPTKFTLALLLIGIGLIILPIGIHFAANNGLVSFNWIFYSYCLQSLGELFIGPIGYAMVGQLAPRKLQGIFMGTWMMFSGVGAVLSNYASGYAIKNLTTTDPIITNPGYAGMFNFVGWSAFIFGILLLVLIPMIKRLTQE